MNEQSLLAALPQFPSFLCLYAPDRTIAWCNTLGYGRECTSVIGECSDEHVMESDRVWWQEMFRRAVYLRETSIFTLNLHTPHPPGFLRVQGKIGPIIHNGSVIYVATVSTDVTAHTPVSTINPLARFFFTPLCRATVAYLLENGHSKGASIGKAIGELSSNGQASPKLRAILSSLQERCVVAHSPGGYHVSDAFSPFIACALLD